MEVKVWEKREGKHIDFVTKPVLQFAISGLRVTRGRFGGQNLGRMGRKKHIDFVTEPVLQLAILGLRVIRRSGRRLKFEKWKISDLSFNCY